MSPITKKSGASKTREVPLAEIEVVVAADGTVTVEAKGVVGPGCTELTKALEEALGTVESRSCKVEFYEQVEAGEQLSQREG